MMWYVTHFDDILKMKALKEPSIMIPDLQTSIGKSCMCNLAQQEKGTLQLLEIYKHNSAQQ